MSFTKYTLVLLLATMFNSCRNDIDDAFKDLDVYFFHLTYEFSHNGTNVIDSLKKQGVEVASSLSYRDAEYDDANFSFIRERDNKNATCRNRSWEYVTDSRWGRYNISGYKEPRIPRTYLHLEYLSDNGWKKEERDESFCFRIKCKKIFKDDNNHTLRITAHLYGKDCNFKTTKIELDEKELLIDSVQVEQADKDVVELFVDWEV